MCLLVSVAIYVRIGEFTEIEQERDAKTAKILSLMMERSGDGSRVNPVDVLDKLIVVEAKIEEIANIQEEMARQELAKPKQ